MRLKGSLSNSAIEQLKNIRTQLQNRDSNEPEESQIYVQRKIFKEYENLLDKQVTGPIWLGKKEIANLVEESIQYRNSKLYDLYAYCIMPNHLHLVFKHLVKKDDKETPITDIMQNFKRYTARECNKLLNRTGHFWQPESYDRVIRNTDELGKTIRYTLNNPVKAGMVKHWKDWPHSYCKPEFEERLK